MNNIPIYSVVAFSGTGKTTLIEKLIVELKGRGLRVAVIKHDAHEFDIDHEGKDSWRFTQAGADITIVASESKAAIMENRPIPLEELLGKISDVDIIITEGYRQGNRPKIAIHRNATGKPLPIPPEDCFAIVTDDGSAYAGLPCFGLNDISGLADFIIASFSNMDPSPN